MTGTGRRRRSALPLPRYTCRMPLAGGRWGYYFKPPTWALKPRPEDERGPCPVAVEALGTDYDAAVKRVEKVLLPIFDSWRTRGVIDMTPAAGGQHGTLDWLFKVYRGDHRFLKLRPKVKRVYNQGLDLIGNYVMKDGRRLGEVTLAAIDANVVDKLYQALLPMRDAAGNPLALFPEGSLTDAKGDPLYAERRTTVNNAMKYCRRAWNVAKRVHPKEVPANPFADMDLASRSKEVEAATYAELLAAVAQADAMGLPSLGTALMVTWEWLQREEHIFTAFELAHYRPKNRPNEVFIADPKTDESRWYPLYDQAGVPLFPELMARMDAARANRVGNGLFFVRDWVDRRAKVPVPWATQKGQIDLVGIKLRKALDAAGVDRSISFTSFRHGGLTECGDAELTDRQIRALSRHRSSKVLGRYVKRTERQIIDGTKKRRSIRPAAPAQDNQLDLFGGAAKGGSK
jgi:hypothetical protein